MKRSSGRDGLRCIVLASVPTKLPVVVVVVTRKVVAVAREVVAGWMGWLGMFPGRMRIRI